MILVARLSDLKFLVRVCCKLVRNFKSAALAFFHCWEFFPCRLAARPPADKRKTFPVRLPPIRLPSVHSQSVGNVGRPAPAIISRASASRRWQPPAPVTPHSEG